MNYLRAENPVPAAENNASNNASKEPQPSPWMALFGSIRMPVELWAPWCEEGDAAAPTGLAEVRTAINLLLRPEVVLDILENFTVFATDAKHQKIKVICRFQQYYTVNQIVQRVVEGRIKKA